MIMRADPQLDSSPPDGSQISIIKVFLTEMHPVRADINGDAPVIIHHHGAGMAAALRKRILQQ